MASPKSTEAKDFLLEIGLGEYVDELITKHKFEKISDLKMITNLDEKLFAQLNLPLCLILTLKREIEKISTEKDQTAQPTPSNPETMTELPKKKLIELGKKNMAAQFANCKTNEFNSFLAGKVDQFNSESKWQGAGGLRVSAGTSLGEAQENNLLALSILDSSELQPILGVYKIPEHGICTLNRKRGKTFIGNKLSALRKPSAYKRKETSSAPKNTSSGEMETSRDRSSKNASSKEMETSRDRSSKNNASKGMETSKNSSSKEMKSNVQNKGKKRILSDIEDEDELTNVQKEKEAEEQNNYSEEDEEETESDFEKKRRLNIERNKKELLKIGLLNKSQSTIVCLYFLKCKQMKQVQMKVLKEAAKKCKIIYQKTTTKEELCQMLGNSLFTQKKVVFKDSSKGITFDNLKLSRED